MVHVAGYLWNDRPCSGFTALVHKVDALVYTLALEVNTGDRQQSISDYGKRVISCLLDQGTFLINSSFVLCKVNFRAINHVI